LLPIAFMNDPSPQYHQVRASERMIQENCSITSLAVLKPQLLIMIFFIYRGNWLHGNAPVFRNQIQVCRSSIKRSTPSGWDGRVLRGYAWCNWI